MSLHYMLDAYDHIGHRQARRPVRKPDPSKARARAVSSQTVTGAWRLRMRESEARNPQSYWTRSDAVAADAALLVAVTGLPLAEVIELLREGRTADEIREGLR